MKALGYLMQLDLGLQYPPAWMFNAPDGQPAQPERRFANQFGQAFTTTASGKNTPNAVFSQAVRDDMAEYIAAVFARLGTDWHSVRTGGGKYGETNYPENGYTDAAGTHVNSYWAFDIAAQSGARLAGGVSVCPVPGWKPGDASPNGEASRFVEWYLDSITNYHAWQIGRVRASGFTGLVLALYGSSIVRPGDIAAAVAVNLNGASPRWAEIAEGKDFRRMIHRDTDPGIVVHCTWVDAKNFNDVSTNPANWTPVHFLRYCVDTHPLNTPAGAFVLRMWGENTGNAKYVETPAAPDGNPLVRTFSRMNTHGLMGILWAFEDQLYAPPESGFITFDDFAAYMSAYP
jgi:hypothetical protein